MSFSEHVYSIRFHFFFFFRVSLLLFGASINVGLLCLDGWVRGCYDRIAVNRFKSELASAMAFCVGEMGSRRLGLGGMGYNGRRGG
jgi:hypothetical protein